MSGSTNSTITTYYQKILFRDPTPSELSGWSAGVGSGSLTLAQVRSTLIESVEASSFVDPVIRLYQAAFGRVPESSGAIDFYADKLRAGTWTVADIANNFAASPEFAGRYGSSGPNAGYITALYVNVLGRPPAGVEVEWYLKSGMTSWQMLLGFSQSPEFQARSADAVDALLEANALGTAVFSGPLAIEPSTFTLSASAPQVTEGNAGDKALTFTLTLDRAPTEAVTINYETLGTGLATPGEDFGIDAGTVTFAAGQRTATVSVAVKGDTTFERDETVKVLFSGASLSGAVEATGTILNDDTNPATQIYTLTSDAPAITEGNAGTKALTFTLTLDRAPTEAVTVNYRTLSTGSATPGEDFGIAAGTVTFAAGQRTATVSVAVNGDTVFEPNQTVKVELSGASLSGTVEATGTITNDDIDPALNPANFAFTSGTDNLRGTAGNDEFVAYLQQNATAGGVSNSLSSADQLDGLGGKDSLYAEVTVEFVGGASNGVMPDIQPWIRGVEQIEFEARDLVTTSQYTSGTFTQGEDSEPSVVVDAKWISGVERIGSAYSDGDLVIENLTTLTDAGTKRNTESITITMDHTDNFNSDGDASDLTVYFDDNYLLSGTTSKGQAFFFLLDELAEEAGNANRLANINVDGIIFRLGTQVLTLENPAAQTAGTHAGFVAALQGALANLIAAGSVPAGTTLTLDPTVTDTTFLDDGSQSKPIPAIVLTTGDGTKVTPLGYSQVADLVGNYDVYGDFTSEHVTTKDPVAVNVELHKVGRGGEGGDLIIGAKSQTNGIPVMNVAVLGNESKPSDLGVLGTTGGKLEAVYISTHEDYVAGATHASLTIRGKGPGQEAFNQSSLELVDANGFLGDLTLGSENAVDNLVTLNAAGGGKVTFYGELTGSVTDTAFSYTTGSNDDLVDLVIDGDAADFAGSSVTITTAGGDDKVHVTTAMSAPFEGNPSGEGPNDILNQAILKNFTISTGSGDDEVLLREGSQGNFTISAGDGDDYIRTSDTTAKAVWVFNVDPARYVTGGTGSSVPLVPGGKISLEDLPGEPLSLAFIGGAKLTVTLSGAGIDSPPSTLGFPAGGGVMSAAGADADASTTALSGFTNGYESTVTIDVAGPNTYFGTQADINAAILRAINDHPVLGKLLKAEIQSNNTLSVTALVDGAFAPADLDINIVQPKYTSEGYAAAVVTEARAVLRNSSLEVGDLWNVGGTADGTFKTGVSGLADLGDAYYDGLVEPNLHYAGLASTQETDNVINGGAGNDLIVLSTNAATINPPLDFTPSTSVGLLNGASNETIVLSGSFFGHDVVMNFTDRLVDAHANANQPYNLVGGSENDTVNGADFAGQTPFETGVDFLDFRAYLTNTYDSSENSGGTGPDSDVSNKLQPIKLAAGATTAEANALQANEVVVVKLDDFETAVLLDQDWATLETTFLDALRLTGGYTVQPKALNLVQSTQKVIFMVEHDDDAMPAAPGNDSSSDINLGHYKVFEVTMSDGSAGKTDGATGFLSANYLGSLDFGTTLALTNVNLVGSDDHSNLLKYGFDFSLSST